MSVSHILTIFIIATVPVVFAAVQPWVWAFYGGLIIVAYLALLWNSDVALAPVSDTAINSALVIFFSATLLLCLPLPASMLAFLSPFRLKTMNTAQVLLSAPVQWQTLSYSPKIAFAWWLFLFFLCLFFVAMRRQFTSADYLKHTVFVMLAVGLIEAVYGLIQALVPTLGVLWVDYIQAYMGDARGTFINRNHFAGFIEMVWPIALGFTLAQGGWRQGYTLKKILSSESLNRQALLALGVVVLLLSLLFSHSRAGITGASMGFLAFIWLSRNRSREISRLMRSMLVGIIGLLVFYSAVMGTGSIADRFLRLEEGDSRLNIWRDSLMILRDHPFGIGLRNYEKAFPVYNVSNLSVDTVVDYAHNDYLQLLIEAGWIGFLAAISGFAIFMWKSISKIRRMDSHKDPLRFFLAVGAFSGLISMAFHSFFDFNLQIPANCVYFVVLLAIVYSCAWSADYAE